MAVETIVGKDGKKKYKVIVYTHSEDGKEKRVKKTFLKKNEAIAFEAETKLYVKSKIIPTSELGKTTLNQLFELYKDKKQSVLADGTFITYESNYQTWIKDDLGFFQVRNIGESTVEEFFDRIDAKGIGKSARIMTRTLLNEIFKFATQRAKKYMVYNPIGIIEKPRKSKTKDYKIDTDKYWTHYQAETFIEVNRRHKNIDLYRFILNTGLRIDEALALTKKSFNLEQKTVRIEFQLAKYKPRKGEPELAGAYYMGQTKTGSTRVIPLNEEAFEIAKKLCLNAKNEYFVFSKKSKNKIMVFSRKPEFKMGKSNHLGYRAILNEFKKLAKKADVIDIGLHGLRHTFAANFLTNGGDIYTLSVLLGHSSVETTRIYGHLSRAHMSASVSMIGFSDRAIKKPKSRLKIV